MTSMESTLTFWTLTITSAKEAVQLYFAPLWHIGEWEPQHAYWRVNISPDLGWFFGAIKPEAGVGSIEKEVFEKASYGRQLGLILDVLLPLVGEGSLDSEKAKKALADLKNVYEEIEKVQVGKKAEMENAAVALLRKIETTDKEMLSRVINQFRL